MVGQAYTRIDFFPNMVQFRIRPDVFVCLLLFSFCVCFVCFFFVTEFSIFFSFVVISAV